MKIKPNPFYAAEAAKRKKETPKERTARLAAEQIARNKARNKIKAMK